MMACDLFLYMYESRRTVQSLPFGPYIFQELYHHGVLGLSCRNEIEISSRWCRIFPLGDGIYNPQNEMLPFHKTKCSETQNEASSL